MSAMPTLSAHTLLAGGDQQPPLILVHGAANSGRVWSFWQDELARRGWSSHAIDLRGHGASGAADLGTTGMADYADDVVAFARTLRQRLIGRRRLTLGAGPEPARAPEDWIRGRQLARKEVATAGVAD
jgi:pimeloyl-ACP methyl ester carboxylesterase